MLEGYYCLTDGREHGPYSYSAIRELLAAGDLKEALIRSGNSVWKTPEELGFNVRGESPPELGSSYVESKSELVRSSQGTSRCTKCNGEIGGREAACSRCRAVESARADRTVEKATIDCFECGEKIDRNAKSCPECGVPLALREPPIAAMKSSGLQRSAAKPSTPAPHPAADFSAVHFRQPKANRHKTGFVVGIVLACLVLGGAGVFSYKSFTKAGRSSSEEVGAPAPAAEASDFAGQKTTGPAGSTSSAHDEAPSNNASSAGSALLPEASDVEAVSTRMLEAPKDGTLTVTGRWRYGDGTQQESDEGEWFCLELDPSSMAKSPLLKKFEGSVCVINPERAMRQMSLASLQYRERCAYRAEGTATVELGELRQPPYDEMNGDRIEASLVRVLVHEISKPLTEEDCYSGTISSSASDASPANEYVRPFSPSFSCDAATSEAEHAICGNEELASLDRKVAEAYAQALAVNGETRRSVVSGQREWIRARDSQCRGDVACLRQVMTRRVGELKG